ncbi:MAG TPA: hypothetical protein VFN56_01010 [Candidatus Saccharimonadales bacterium]|nr:hypothetical protein [Candidatus Saccharimonadales bacterium]
MTAPDRPILIAATSLDEHAYAPVCKFLESAGHPVVLYRTDRVISGADLLELNLSESGNLNIRYNHTPIEPGAVSAAWYRKVANFTLPQLVHDRARQLYVNSEIRHLHEDLWSLYPESLWLNAPERMRRHDRKIGQLMLAKEVGFSIPETLMASDWEAVEQHLLDHNDEIIVKVARGIISEGDRLKALYTTRLDKHRIQQLKSDVTPFPGLYQPFLQKHREWRVTVVGDNVFPVAIYTNENARNDWRVHQTTDAVVFREEALPKGVDELCLRFLGKCGLKFGAFDLVEKPDGAVIFLECNPNGQYGWLEEELGLQISKAIAEQLLSIAESSVD